MSSTTCIYNILVFGEPGVGKTCFIDQFSYGKSFVRYDPAVVPTHDVVVDGQASRLTLIDLSTAFLKPEQEMQPTRWAEDMLARAEGVVLLYDITSLESFRYITDQAYKFLMECRRLKSVSDDEADEEEREDFGCVLVGNKLDLTIVAKESRRVGQSLAEEWAQTQSIKNIEVDSLGRSGPEDALKLLVKSVKRIEKLGGTEPKVREKQEEEASGEEKKKSPIWRTLKAAFKSSRT